MNESETNLLSFVVLPQHRQHDTRTHTACHASSDDTSNDTPDPFYHEEMNEGATGEDIWAETCCHKSQTGRYGYVYPPADYQPSDDGGEIAISKYYYDYLSADVFVNPGREEFEGVLDDRLRFY